MINECIILAGGLGTRLRSAVPDLPKCMAPVAGRPFLSFVINRLIQQGAKKFIFSLGYKYEMIQDFVNTQYPQLKSQYSIEADPLGTGGAIKLAAKKVTAKTALVVNGDTLFNIRLNTLDAFHQEHGADCTLSLKPMKNFDRYGIVELNTDQRIKSFREKQFYKEGLINGGIYALQVTKFLEEAFPEKFSFEKDYLEKLYTTRQMFGVIQDEYFIDIGIPEDYEKAGRELAN